MISKSGTTTEPAIAFRLLKDMLVKEAGAKDAAKRIVAITDAKRGALRSMSDTEGYKTFVIDDNVGGRFPCSHRWVSLPIATAGYDIRALIAGAAAMEASDQTDALTYAATRNALYRAGKKTEILVNYCPKLHFFGEWWKQLYGERRQGWQGHFPRSCRQFTDLHSMGQWIQDGERTIFETVLSVEAPGA